MSSGLEAPDKVQDAIEEGPTRYAAFAMRLRTLITASSRYVAYTSDIGESFRPLISPMVVRGAYGISWAYILGDCGYAGYLAHKERSEMPTIKEKAAESLTLQQKVELRKRQLHDEMNVGKVVKLNPLELSEPSHVGLVVARRAVFQSLASMALPAFTIHSIVRYSAPLFARAQSRRVKAAGPTVAGLAAVPALPFLFDEPVEHAVDFSFDWIEARIAEAMAKTKKKIDVPKDHLHPEQPRKDESRASPAAAVRTAAILGIGVDLMFLPRLRALLSRQAARIQAGQSRTPTPSNALKPALGVAAERMAHRILHEREKQEWEQEFAAEGDDISARQLQWLAVRWTAKEAAFKAVSGHRGFSQASMPLSWRDAYVTTASGEHWATSGRPEIVYSPYVAKTWREYFRKEERQLCKGQESARQIPMPKIHLSITHDGDYVSAFVVAEGVEPASE